MDATHTYILIILIITQLALHSAMLAPNQFINYGNIEYMQKVLEIALKVDTNETWGEAWLESVANANQPMDQYSFECTVEHSKSNPTSVHTLRPSDIRVVAALGGSISTGTALDAEDVIDVTRQLRGESFSVGGDGSLSQGVVTLPNILKLFNPNVKGFSTGFGKEDISSSWLNRAVPGAVASNMLSQAMSLVSKIRIDKEIDFYADWKLVTLFIGGTDICLYCEDMYTYSADEYKRHVKETLDYLKGNLPRTFVNILMTHDYSPMISLSDNFLCQEFQRTACPCAMDPVTVTELRSIQLQYYGQIRDLLLTGIYDSSDNFTAVLQPHLVNMNYVVDPGTKEVDMSYFASDCFHPSRKGQQLLAYMLWNIMITPIGAKPLKYPLEKDLRVQCPQLYYPYIFTTKNSQDTDYWRPSTSGYPDPNEPEEVKDESSERLQFVFLMIIVGLAIGLAGVVVMGVFIPLVDRRKDDKSLPQPTSRRPSACSIDLEIRRNQNGDYDPERTPPVPKAVPPPRLQPGDAPVVPKRTTSAHKNSPKWHDVAIDDNEPSRFSHVADDSDSDGDIIGVAKQPEQLPYKAYIPTNQNNDPHLKNTPVFRNPPPIAFQASSENDDRPEPLRRMETRPSKDMPNIKVTRASVVTEPDIDPLDIAVPYPTKFIAPPKMSTIV